MDTDKRATECAVPRMAVDTARAGRTLHDAALTRQVIGTFYDVYNELGAGFLESVYENAFCIALREAGLEVAQQVPLTVQFRGHVIGQFRVDLLIASQLIVEVKATSQLSKPHEVQLVNYLKATGRHVGLLVNFGPKPQVKRRVFGDRAPSRKDTQGDASVDTNRHR